MTQSLRQWTYLRLAGYIQNTSICRWKLILVRQNVLCWCGFCLIESTYKWKVFFTHQSHLWSSTGLCAETNAIHPQKVPLWTVVVDQCHDNLHMNDQQTDLTARCSSVKPWDHDQVWNTEPPPNPDIAPDETFDPQTRSASTFISTLHSVYKKIIKAIIPTLTAPSLSVSVYLVLSHYVRLIPAVFPIPSLHPCVFKSCVFLCPLLCRTLTMLCFSLRVLSCFLVHSSWFVLYSKLFTTNIKLPLLVHAFGSYPACHTADLDNSPLLSLYMYNDIVGEPHQLCRKEYK